MGSRSKGKSVRAIVPGRQIGPRPKKPWTPKLTAAFWENLREKRQKIAKGEKMVQVATTAEPKASRAQRRTVTFALAKNLMPYLVEDARPRAERRRQALAEAKATVQP
jgi:hypothetical protein